MKLYEIANWHDVYENNRTRELKKLLWVPIPTQLDGDGYTELVDRKNGAAIYGAWVACVIVAGRCDPRGRLVRDGGRPHDSASLARITRLDKTIISEMLGVAESVGWITSYEISQEGARFSQDAAQKEGIEGTELKEGKEEKQMGTKVREVWEFYLSSGDHQGAKLTDKRKSLISRQLKNYDFETLCKAIYGCHLTPFNCGQNSSGQTYLDIKHCIGSDERIERFCRHADSPPKSASDREIVNTAAVQGFLNDDTI